MKRINELQDKPQGANEEVATITATPTVINKETNKDHESESEDNNVKNEISEEKAARIFPLNLISNRFKLKDSSALKGRYLARILS